MHHPEAYNNQRQTQRVALSLPIQISYGSQITVLGQIKDLSLKSAFVRIKNSVFIQSGDEIGLTIGSSSSGSDEGIQVLARVSRIVGGEGFAVYFTKIDDNALDRIQKLLQKS